MTRDEHEVAITEQRNAMEALFANRLALYNTHIQPLKMRYVDLEHEAVTYRYLGKPDEANEIMGLMASLELDIKSREIELGLAGPTDEEDQMEQTLETMKINAHRELTEYEYYTSSIPTTQEKQMYFAKIGLVCNTIFGTFDVITVNNLNKKFNQDEHIPVLEGISPFMPTNQVIDGMDVVHYTIDLSYSCTIAYNKEKTTWYLLMEEDIVFESENLIDIFEYRNIVG